MLVPKNKKYGKTLEKSERFFIVRAVIFFKFLRNLKIAKLIFYFLEI